MQSQPTSTVTFDRALLDDPYRRRKVSYWLRGWVSTQSQNSQRFRFADLNAFAAFVLGEEVTKPKDRDNTRSALAIFELLHNGHAQRVSSEYVDTLLQKTYSPQTISRKIRSVQKWAEHLDEQGAVLGARDMIMVPSLSELRTMASRHTALPKAEESELQDLPTSARPGARDFLQSRDHTIVGLHKNAALPPSVLQNLNWSAVDFVDDLSSPDEPPMPAGLRIPRSNGQTHWHRLGHHATSSLRGWAGTYKKRFGATLPDRPVFVSLSGERLSSSRLYQIVDA